MDAYRDQYAKLFNDGKDVKVFGISIDADTALASWAKDANYPVTFLSDPGAEVGKLYGIATKYKETVLDSRALFVIDRKGKITHVMSPFRETDPTAYTELEAAVDVVAGGNL
jgi:peroxiredoxin